jgi:hypothetical protein
MWIRFKTDDSIQLNGFRIIYEFAHRMPIYYDKMFDENPYYEKISILIKEPGSIHKQPVMSFHIQLYFSFILGW